jgi:hypothetical protein
MSRELTKMKMFNKKDDERKKKRNEKEIVAFDIKDKSKEIEELDIQLDRESRKLGNRALLKKQ